MSLYQYQAYNSNGSSIRGVVDAEDLSALEARLRGQGLWLQEAHEAGRSSAQSPSGALSSWTVGRADLIHFFVQMTLLLKAGITLPQALERLGADNAERRLGQVVNGIHEQVTVGTSLHLAMGRYPKVFSNQVTAMIEAGEVSGQLPEVFESLASYYEWTDQLTSDVRQALIYPLMVMSAAVALIIMLFTFVVPRFVGLLTDLNMKVPALTQVVMALSNIMIKGWPILLATVIAVPVLLKIALRQPDFACAWDKMLMGLPVFGSLFAMFGFSRFSHNLAMLTRAGIPLLRGLEICQHLVGNRALARGVADARKRVMEGTPLHRALGEQKLFPPTLLTMVATGESSGKVEFALSSISDYYNKLIPRRIKIVFAIFDPVMMVSLIAVVGTVALSVILPILQLWEAK